MARQMPVDMRALGRGRIAVRVTALQQRLTGIPAGWRVYTLDAARRIADACERNGRADRSNPRPAGERISLQRMAAQIRAKL